MDWLVIAIGVLFLLGFAIGVYRGAIKIAVSLLATVVTFILVFFATPYVSRGIAKVTPIQDMVEAKVESMMVDMVTGSEETESGASVEEAMVRNALSAAGVTEKQLEEQGITVSDIAQGNVSSDALAEMGISRNLLDGLKNQQPAKQLTKQEIEELEIPRDVQIAALEGADIPEVFRELLLTNNNTAIYEKLGATSFPAYVAKYMGKLVVNIVAFLLTLLVVTIILRAIIFSLNVIADLPGVGVVNRLAGGFLGLAVVLIIVWVFFVVVTLIYTTSIGKEMFRTIQDNEWLAMIYEYNPVIKLATTIKQISG